MSLLVWFILIPTLEEDMGKIYFKSIRSHYFPLLFLKERGETNLNKYTERTYYANRLDRGKFISSQFG